MALHFVHHIARGLLFYVRVLCLTAVGFGLARSRNTLDAARRRVDAIELETHPLQSGTCFGGRASLAGVLDPRDASDRQLHVKRIYEAGFVPSGHRERA
jgi:hypothetical protein